MYRKQISSCLIWLWIWIQTVHQYWLATVRRYHYIFLQFTVYPQILFQVPSVAQLRRSELQNNGKGRPSHRELASLASELQRHTLSPAITTRVSSALHPPSASLQRNVSLRQRHLLNVLVFPFSMYSERWICMNFNILTAVKVSMMSFWSSGIVDRYQRFGETCCLIYRDQDGRSIFVRSFGIQVQPRRETTSYYNCL
jgi:hypothetical protein